MGMPVTRVGDISTGHGAFAPRPANECSPDVNAEGNGVVRESDDWTTHCVGPSCHEGAVQQGSSTVFVNGKGAVRMGDEIDCGGMSMQGAVTVFVGD